MKLNDKRDLLKGLSREELLKVIQKSKAKRTNGLTRVSRDVSSFKQSYSQQRQWFMEQFMSGGVYNVVQSYLLKGELQVAYFQKAICTLVEKHESLRTVFCSIDYVPSQIIKPYEDFDVECIDLRNISLEQQEQRVKELNHELANKPFNLTTGPLYRFCIMKLSDTKHVLSLSLHHIISDGWSFGVIMKELGETYKAYLNGNFMKQELAIQYVDYSEWQLQRIERGELDTQLDYWKKQLADIPERIHLPYDHKRGKMQNFTGKTESFSISLETLQKMNAYCNQEQASIYHFMLTAYMLMLHCYSLEQEICVGTPVANRNRVELEKVIGLFINTVVIKNSMDEDETINSVFHSIKKSSEEAFNHSEIPFEKVVESLNVKRNAQYSPVFQVLYVQTEESMLQVDVPGIAIEVIPISTDTAQFELSLYATIMKESVVCGFEYNTSLFQRDTVLQMIIDFKNVIDFILNHSEMIVSELRDVIGKKKLRCVVASSFVVEPVMDVLDYWQNEFALPCQFQLAPYSQIFQELIEENSLLSNSDLGILVLRIEDWIQGKEESEEKMIELLSSNVDMFEKLFERYLEKGHYAILYLCPISDGLYESVAYRKVISKLMASMSKKYGGHENVILIEGEKVVDEFELAEYYDPFGDKEGHIPYIREYFTAMGTEMIRMILKKCFITQ